MHRNGKPIGIWIVFEDRRDFVRKQLRTEAQEERGLLIASSLGLRTDKLFAMNVNRWTLHFVAIREVVDVAPQELAAERADAIVQWLPAKLVANRERSAQPQRAIGSDVAHSDAGPIDTAGKEPSHPK